MAEAEQFRKASAENLPPEAQQLMMSEIDRRYLTPVPTYWDQAHSILTERVRFSLYGALGVFAAGSSAVVALELNDLHWLTYAGFAALFVSVIVSWFAHGLIETLAYDRISDRVTQYQNAMAGLFPSGFFKPIPNEEMEEVRSQPIRRSDKIRLLANLSATIAMFGAFALLTSLAMTLEKRPADPRPAVQAEAAPRDTL